MPATVASSGWVHQGQSYPNWGFRAHAARSALPGLGGMCIPTWRRSSPAVMFAALDISSTLETHQVRPAASFDQQSGGAEGIRTPDLLHATEGSLPLSHIQDQGLGAEEFAWSVIRGAEELV